MINKTLVFLVMATITLLVGVASYCADTYNLAYGMGLMCLASGCGTFLYGYINS